jgi:tryptophan 2,3-dioxygenase
MALLPASGFQSAQFRQIEIACTDGWQLIEQPLRGPEAEGMSAKEVYKNMYWRKGATETGTGQKTLTLRRFEEKYAAELERCLADHAETNLRRQYLKASNGNPSPELRDLLLTLDKLLNVEWRLVHFKSAVRYLHQQPTGIPATGGTNWKKYLPPHIQLNRFFPELGEFE